MDKMDSRNAAQQTKVSAVTQAQTKASAATMEQPIAVRAMGGTASATAAAAVQDKVVPSIAGLPIVDLRNRRAVVRATVRRAPATAIRGISSRRPAMVAGDSSRHAAPLRAVVTRAESRAMEDPAAEATGIIPRVRSLTCASRLPISVRTADRVAATALTRAVQTAETPEVPTVAAAQAVAVRAADIGAAVAAAEAAGLTVAVAVTVVATAADILAEE